MFSLNEWFPKTKAVLDSVQADIVLACLLLNSTQVLAELCSAQLKLVLIIFNSILGHLQSYWDYLSGILLGFGLDQNIFVGLNQIDQHCLYRK